MQRLEPSLTRNPKPRRTTQNSKRQTQNPKLKTYATSDSYIFFVSAAIVDQLNFSTARLRPASPNFLRNGSSLISRLTFCAKSRENLSGSTGSNGLSCICSNGTRNPVSPSTTT